MPQPYIPSDKEMAKASALPLRFDLVPHGDGRGFSFTRYRDAQLGLVKVVRVPKPITPKNPGTVTYTFRGTDYVMPDARERLKQALLSDPDSAAVLETRAIAASTNPERSH